MNYDEFIGFTLFGIYSKSMKVYAISDGSRYTTPLFADFVDITDKVSGMDGLYYFGTDIESYTRDIRLYIDYVNEIEFRNIQAWLHPQKIGKLSFDEAPYKYYIVKLSRKPDFQFVPYEDIDGVGHVYAGEMVITVMAFYPFAQSYFNSLQEMIYNDPRLYYNSGILYSDYIPKSYFINITNPQNLILYNGGNQKSKCVVKVTGKWDELIIANETTNQVFSLKKVEDISTFEIDAVKGQVRLSGNLASRYHEGSYIEVAGNDNVEQFENVLFSNGSAIVVFPEDVVLHDNVVGKHVFMPNKHYKIIEKISDNQLRLAHSFYGETGNYNIVIATANEISITGSNLDIEEIKFIYRYTYL